MENTIYTFSYEGRIVTSGTADELIQNISELNLPKPKVDTMRKCLQEKGEYRFYMGLCEVRPQKVAA
jgi:hypothetical protein